MGSGLKGGTSDPSSYHVFLKAYFWILHFSYYTLMTFLLFSVILLPMLMILFSTLGMSKHIESELQDIIGWDRLQPADFNAGRT